MAGERWIATETETDTEARAETETETDTETETEYRRVESIWHWSLEFLVSVFGRSRKVTTRDK